MNSRMLVPNLVLSLAFLPSGMAQQSPSQSPSLPVSSSLEFPVVLRQNVTAGKTHVGTKVEARLSVATLVDHTVVPRNATLFGEVVQSDAKSQSAPSRLAIRMDRAEWKDGSKPIKAYLTFWYYPTLVENGQNLQYGPDQGSRNWNGQGQYPNSSRGYKPFPGSESGQESSVPDTPAAVASKHKAQMKDVAEEKDMSDGTMILVSKRSDIKLDRYTMYVLAGDAPIPNPAENPTPSPAQK